MNSHRTPLHTADSTQQPLPCRGCTTDCSQFPECNARPWRERQKPANACELTVFYDSQCPLCLMEMKQLKRLDEQHRIDFVDIHHKDFKQSYPHIDAAKAYKVLHVEKASGDVLLGLDGSCAIWNAVGRHRWLNLLRLPVIKFFADKAYHLFAKYRGLFALLLTGQRTCNRCQI